MGYTYVWACFRFHMLPEFDDGKRSCRKRLADHNRRRRKPAAPMTTSFKPVAEVGGTSPGSLSGPGPGPADNANGQPERNETGHVASKPAMGRPPDTARGSSSCSASSGTSSSSNSGGGGGGGCVSENGC